MESGALRERKTPAQFVIRQRLIGRLEGNAGDRKSFVLESFFEKRGVFFLSGCLPRLCLAEISKCAEEQDQKRGC
jgi:hypothetical protein